MTWIIILALALTSLIGWAAALAYYLKVLAYREFLHMLGNEFPRTQNHITEGITWIEPHLKDKVEGLLWR